jgi:predicted alpha/beta hydrolase
MLAAMNAAATEQPFSVTAADGYPLHGTEFAPAGSPRGSVVIASALGVQRRVYTGFAAACAARGLRAFTFDYRGIGDSKAGPIRGRDLRMEDWGRHDIDAVLRHAAHTPGKRFLVGHSCGAQLPGLASASADLDAAVFVAGSAPRASLYPFPDRAILALLWNVLIPALARGRDELPRRLAPGGAQFPAGVSRQWAEWARSEKYLFDHKHGIDTSRYATLRLPVLALSFDDDNYAPPRALEALLVHYPAARIDRRHVSAREAGGKLGHFGFFRPAMRDPLWTPTLDWLLP